MKKNQALNADGKVCVFNGTEWINPDKVQEEHTEDIKQPQQFKPKQLRTRRFCISSYINPDSLETFVSSLPWVQHWAMTTHDRDINEDGTPKDVHTHILLYTYETKTASAIKKKFDNFSREIYQGTDTEPQNTLVQICHDMSAQWRYLIHKDDPDKAQYDPQKRICDNFSYWNKLELTNGMTDSHKNIALAIISDINDGCSEADLVLRYGREYVINRRRYLECAVRIRYEMNGPIMREWDLHEVLEICLASIHHRTTDEKRIFLEMFNEVNVECIMSYGDSARFIFDGKKLEEMRESAEYYKKHRTFKGG